LTSADWTDDTDPVETEVKTRTKAKIRRLKLRSGR
jgi:hypothetical protein